MPFLIQQLLNQRHILAVATILVGGLVVWGAQHTSLDATYKAILSDGDPYRSEVEQAQIDFPPGTSVLFAFMPQRTPDASADSSRRLDVFNIESLHAMDELTRRYGEIDAAIAVGSLSNRRLNAADAERYDRDYLVPDLASVDAAALNQIRRIALADDDLTKSLLSPEADMALAIVRYALGTDAQSSRLDVARSVIDLRDSLRENHPGERIYVLGNALFELDSYNATNADNRTLFPLVLLTSTLLLWLCLKSLSYSLCLLGIAFATILLSVGTYGWLDIPFNQISRLGPLVVLVIAIADGIHIISIYAQGLHRGLGKLDAMRDSLALNIQAVTLATMTTTMGFLSLNYCTSPGIYGFGNVIAIGVCWAYLLTLTLLPALILLLPTRKVPEPLGVRAFIDAVSRLVARRGNALFWGSMLLIVTTLALLPLNKLDFNRYSFIDKNSDLHQVMSALAEKIGNDQSLVYSIDSGTYYGITEPDFLDQVDTFSRWLESQPEASFVRSYTDLLRAMNQSEHDDDQAFDVLPVDKLQVIDYLVGYQLVQEIEPNLETIFNSDYSAIRLVVATSNLSNAELIAFNDRIDRWIANNLSPGFKVLHGDNSILFARLDQSISRELIQGFTLSFVLITLTMVIGLKSLRYGLLSIMPNLFPATIVFGFWGLFVGELSPYILMLFSISIGLVVDDSVHILSKYISARRAGATPEAAVQYALDTAGSAITITTLSLAVGTFILVFSNTFHFQNLALLLTPIIVVALLLDLLFLPPLLVKFDHWSARRQPVAATAG